MFGRLKRSSKSPKPPKGAKKIPPGIFIYLTCANIDEARKISAALVEQRLVACANIMAPHAAIYRWEGKMAASNEIPVLLKTRLELFEKAKDAIIKMHSYACPCVVAFPITRAHASYMAWVADSTEKTV